MSTLNDLLEKGMKPTTPSPDELAAAAALGLGDFEILSEKLVLIAEEGKQILTMMGISSMLHSGDTLVGVYTAAGDLVAPVCGTYLHARLTTMICTPTPRSSRTACSNSRSSIGSTIRPDSSAQALTVLTTLSDRNVRRACASLAVP